jgi:DNA replication and repair protein RecF
MSALEAEEKIEALLRNARADDARLGGSQIGPHQTQVQFFHMERKKFAEFCSTGEQKALLLSLILANCRLHQKSRHKAPILLLDEVIAHLDSDRREMLYKEILDLKMQCWMTGTDQKVFFPLGEHAQYFCVENRNAIKQPMKVE